MSGSPMRTDRPRSGWSASSGSGGSYPVSRSTPSSTAHTATSAGTGAPFQSAVRSATFTFSRGRYWVRSGVTSTARRLLFLSTLSFA